MEIIGRKREIRALENCELSEKPEFVVIYGRRRVGKTFLVTQHFKEKFTFSVTGVSGKNTKDQLYIFRTSLAKHFDVNIPEVLSNWYHAFDVLEKCLEQDITSGKKVLFIDEMPWLDTPKSNFISALEHFWNDYASRKENILLIVCGSSASLINKKLLNNYGGLYNRITKTIILEPFNLHECELFFQSKGIAMNRQQIAEAYMIMGGIPYYMGLFDKMYGLYRNIDILFFARNAELNNEFAKLYSSLFRVADNHIHIAEILAAHTSGLTRQEIAEVSMLSDGGGLTNILTDMEACGLVSRSYNQKNKKGSDIFKLTDFYTLFYFKYLKGKKNNDPYFWTNYLSNPAHSSWCGYAFERLCMAHIQQIKQKLGISGVITDVYTFRSKQKKGGAQIDIIIDRKDDVINLCECKFTAGSYALTEQDAADLLRKKEVFWKETGTKKALHLTMITANGLTLNAQSNNIQSQVTLDDLFCSEV